MYPGPEKAIINYKHSLCADGVKLKPKDGEALLPWPQPKGVFSGGTTFHTHTFLNTTKQVYDQFVSGVPAGCAEQALLTLKAEAFAAMLCARTTILLGENSNPPLALFKLYLGIELDRLTPDSHFIKRDSENLLWISYLKEDIRK